MRLSLQHLGMLLKLHELRVTRRARRVKVRLRVLRMHPGVRRQWHLNIEQISALEMGT